MHVVSNPDGTTTLTCDYGELSLIAEGLYAMQKTGQQCLEDEVPDDIDTPVLEAELRQLADMRLALMPALGEEPVFHIVDGGRK